MLGASVALVDAMMRGERLDNIFFLFGLVWLVREKEN